MADTRLIPGEQDAWRVQRGALAERLTQLRDQTGKSQREFAEMLGVDHSTVSVYEKRDGRVPDLEYIDGFLREVRARTAVTEDVLTGTRNLYGTLLQSLSESSVERGRTHNYRQMLRVFQLTLELEDLTAKLETIEAEQRRVQARLEQDREPGPAGSQENLRETVVELRQVHDALAARKDAALFDLESYQAQLHGSRLPVVAPQRPSGPPVVPRVTGPRTSVTAVVAAAVVVTVLGGLLIYRTTGSATTTTQPPALTPSTTTTMRSHPGPSPDPSPPHTSAKPSSELLTSLHQVNHEGDKWLNVGSATVDTTRYSYGHAFVSYHDGNDETQEPCQGWSEYNLDREWKTLRLVVGLDDNAPNIPTPVTVSIDGKILYKGDVSVGQPQRLTLDVTDGLRLRIAFGQATDSGCEISGFVVGNPMLTR